MASLGGPVSTLSVCPYACFILNFFLFIQRMASTPISYNPTPPVKEPKANGAAVVEPPAVPAVPATKVTSGPPVYYPPDHQPFSKAEASMGVKFPSPFLTWLNMILIYLNW